MSSNSGSLAKNTLWNAFERFSLLGIQLLCTFVLARFLTPSDFGIVGMLVIFTEISSTLIESGFVTALIREKNVSNVDYSSVFYLNVIIAFFLYIVLYFCSPLIASFYHEPILTDVSRVTFLVIPILAFQLVQNAIFQRNLQFKQLSIITFISSLVSSIIAIILAVYYRSVWVLVFQNVLTYLMKTVLLWIMTPWHPILSFSWTPIKKYFHFSKNILISGLIGNIFNNINSLLIGHFYTSTDLGFYSQANRMNNVAAHQMTNVVKNVSFPTLAKVNNSGGNLKAAYRKIIMVTLIFVGSIEALLMGISEDLFQILMGGEEWRTAGKYLFILGIAGTLYPLHAVNQNILFVKGDGKTILYLEIARRCILLCILAITVQFSVMTFVAGYSIYSVLLLFLNLHFCGKPINYTFSQQIKDIFPILSAQLFVVIVSLFMNTMFTDYGILSRICITSTVSICLLLLMYMRMPIFKDTINLIINLKLKKK